MSGRESCFGYHSECSEESLRPSNQILRFAQDDKSYLQISNKLADIWSPVVSSALDNARLFFLGVPTSTLAYLLLLFPNSSLFYEVMAYAL